MVRRGWWRPGRSRPARWLARCLALLLGGQSFGCAGQTRVLPRRTNVALVSPWRYYDLWQALRVGRGVLIGTNDSLFVSGRFLSGGAKTVRIATMAGLRDVPIANVRYLINVIDLSQAREGAIAGAVIGLGTGFALAYSTGGTTQTPATRPARAEPSLNQRIARASYDYDDEGSSTATGNSESTNSESSTNTTTSASSTEAGSESQSNAATGAQGASSESSGASTSPTDPTETGSNTYEEDASSGGSSVAGGSGSEPSPTTQQSEGSSGNSTVIVNVGTTQGSNSRSSAGSRNDGQPSGGSSVAPAWRMFYYTVGFAALGSFIGWAIGRTKRKAVPRVDYVLFPANLENQGGRSPDQYLADQIVQPSGEQPAETLLPGSAFDSPRSAMLFEQFAHQGTVVRLSGGIGGVITDADARTYRLFPAVPRFTQAIIVSCGGSAEPSGAQCRYLAVVTTGGRASPVVSLQRLSPRDVIRLGTQVNLIQAGIIQ